MDDFHEQIPRTPWCRNEQTATSRASMSSGGASKATSGRLYHEDWDKNPLVVWHSYWKSPFLHIFTYSYIFLYTRKSHYFYRYSRLEQMARAPIISDTATFAHPFQELVEWSGKMGCFKAENHHGRVYTSLPVMALLNDLVWKYGVPKIHCLITILPMNEPWIRT